MSRRYPKPDLDPEQLTIAWQSASLLLDYPDDGQLERLDLVDAATRTLPTVVGEPLRRLVAHLGTTPLTRLQADYVTTFDSRRRCNLFLTYFAHGDTRKRGVALLRFKQTYLRSGYLLDDSELPDHLCVVLEYAATVDQRLGRTLLMDHRAGLELLRLALHDSGSAWASALEAVSATLPPLRGDERDAVRRLAAEGPPEEEVGLAPFATPSFAAVTPPSHAAEPLPMPGFPGGRE